ncbi:hypothetical protein [Streptomyces sp. NPDC060205]|uniref:hypothetical protein n=1 Tax=Streptomyces sp. NPDC060205 TaxID=3347072 RepID=UPI0036674F82
MKALHRAPLLALLAVTSCGIPATGVVEAGGPASGALPLTPVYFVENGRLAAVPRNTGRPGDPTDALRLLMVGPLADEGGTDVLTTELPLLPTAMAPPSAAVAVPEGSPSAAVDVPEASPSDPSGAAGSVSDIPTVTVAGNVMTIRLPAGMAGLSDLGVRQLVCTATAAYRLTRPGTAALTAAVTGGGHLVRTPDARCPSR